MANKETLAAKTGTSGKNQLSCEEKSAFGLTMHPRHWYIFFPSPDVCTLTWECDRAQLLRAKMPYSVKSKNRGKTTLRTSCASHPITGFP